MISHAPYFLLVFAFLINCTHHTATQQFAAPPEIVSVIPIATGHQILVRAMNPELIFAGYTLYKGQTKTEASSTSNGTACNPAILPNLPAEYSMEVSPLAGPLATPGTNENTNRICKFQTDLQSGQFITIRTQIFSLETDTGKFQYKYSPPSNIFTVP